MAPRFDFRAREPPEQTAGPPVTSTWRRRSSPTLWCAAEAMSGAEVRVPTFSGNVTVSVPAGSQAGRKLRLKGQGVPALKGSGRGDLYLELKVLVPERPSAEAKAAAEALRHAYRGDVRSALRL